MRSDCRLVFEKTSVCDETGTFSPFRSEMRYPCSFSYSSFVCPPVILCCNSAIGSDAAAPAGVSNKRTLMRTAFIHEVISLFNRESQLGKRANRDSRLPRTGVFSTRIRDNETWLLQ